jgi:CheY-like chemotaxis protein
LRDDHDVEICCKPRQALEKLLAGSSFDVIFCDLMMPDLTGMALHAAVAEKLPEQAERFVFVTGGAFTTGARTFVDSVSNTFLDKPFDMKALRAVLAKHVA